MLEPKRNLKIDAQEVFLYHTQDMPHQKKKGTIDEIQY